MPAVIVTGARQTGKSTLVSELADASERTYLTLDDLDVLEQAASAPDDLLARAPRVTVDEVQRSRGCSARSSARYTAGGPLDNSF